MKILRPKAMAQKCGVTTITVHRWATDPRYEHLKFPKPMDLGDNSIGYIEEEADDWLAERAAKRDSAA